MEKILIIQTAFLGDAILTLPMIQKLKEKFSDSEIHVVCIPSTMEIFDSSPAVSKSMALDKKGKDKGLFSLFRFIAGLKKEKYTLVYSPHRSFRSALIVKFLGADKSFGFSNSAFKEAFSNIVKYDGNKHEVQRNLDLCGISYNLESWKIRPELILPVKMEKPLEFFFVNYTAKSKVIAVAPGSVWNTKKYPKEYFKRIIGYFNKKNYLVILVGGWEDKAICDEIASGFDDRVSSAAGQMSVIESIKILTESEIIITNDSAPAHMGMCAGIPVLDIYCSTVPDFGFYPYNDDSSHVSFDDLSCKPCGIHGHKKCPIGTFECAYKLEPELIISKVERILNARNKEL